MNIENVNLTSFTVSDREAPVFAIESISLDNVVVSESNIGSINVITQDISTIQSENIPALAIPVHGQSAYYYAVLGGYMGTEEEFYTALGNAGEYLTEETDPTLERITNSEILEILGS